MKTMEKTQVEPACYLNQDAADIFLDCFDGTLLLAEFPAINRLRKNYPAEMMSVFRREAQDQVAVAAATLNRKFPGTKVYTGWSGNYLLIGVDRETEGVKALTSRFSEKLEMILEVRFQDSGGYVEVQMPTSEAVCVAVNPLGMTTAEELAEKLIRALDQKKVRRMHESSLWNNPTDNNTYLWLPPSPYMNEEDGIRRGAIHNRFTQILRRTLYQKQLRLKISSIIQSRGRADKKQSTNKKGLTVSVDLESVTMLRYPTTTNADYPGTSRRSRAWPDKNIRRLGRRLRLGFELDKAVLDASMMAMEEMTAQSGKDIKTVILPVSLCTLKSQKSQKNLAQALSHYESAHEFEIAVCITGIPETPPETLKDQALLVGWIQEFRASNPRVSLYAELDTSTTGLLRRLPEINGIKLVKKDENEISEKELQECAGSGRVTIIKTRGYDSKYNRAKQDSSAPEDSAPEDSAIYLERDEVFFQANEIPGKRWKSYGNESPTEKEQGDVKTLSAKPKNIIDATHRFSSTKNTEKETSPH